MTGRKSVIESVEIMRVISMHIHHFLTSDLPPLSAEVWKQMSKDFGGKWKPQTCYTYVRENKNGHLYQVLIEKGYNVPKSKSRQKLIDIRDLESPKYDTLTSDSDTSYIDEDDARDNLELFQLLLTPGEWQQIKPDEQNKNRLKKYVWANVLTDALRRRYNFPCAFNYKNSRINSESTQNVHFLQFCGFCRSKRCGNKVRGWAKRPPIDGEHLEVVIKTADTRKCIYHERVYNNIRGEQRQQIGVELTNTSAEKYVQKLIGERMQFGQNVPPHIRPNHIYRQIKMERSKIEQGMKPQEKNDITKKIQKMSQNPQYDNAIRELGSINFYTIYFTNNQLHVYREYLRTMGEKAEISIDATGKFINKFELFEGKKTGHIFLYTATINVENKTIPVSQTITESHDTGFVTFWLDKWLRAGIKAPPQAISDYGRAILLGMCRTFNNMSLKSYIDSCFKWANIDAVERVNTRPAKTLIRVDVAHVMALVARWDCIKRTCHPDVKRFFLRTIALMIDCQEIKEFERVFSLTCAVASQPYENHQVIISTDSISVKEAREKLCNLMMTREIKINEIEEKTGMYEERSEDTPCTAKNQMDLEEDITLTHAYIRELIAKVQPMGEISQLKGEANAYYLPEFLKNLERLAKEFPLWTAAAIPCTTKHASSAYQEGYFGSLRRTLNLRLPTSANRFLHEHIMGIKTGTIVVASNLTHINHSDKKLPSPCLANTSQNIVNENQDTQKTHYLTQDIAFKQNRLKRKSQETILKENRLALKDDSDILSYEEWGGLSKQNKKYMPSLENSFENEWFPSDVPKSPALEENSEYSFEEHFKELPLTHTSSPYTINSRIERVKEIIKEKERKQKGCKKNNSEGFYFKKVLNFNEAMGCHKKSIRVLKNGSILPPVKLNRIYFKVANTCGFDAIANLLYLSALHYPHHFDYIKASTNEFLVFIHNLVDTGPNAAIYKKRLELLQRFYHVQEDFSKTSLDPCYLDATDSIGGLIKKLFSSEPSLLRNKRCSSPSCGVLEINREEELLGVNHYSFGNGFEGFKNLQTSIFYEMRNPIKCQIANCSGLVSENIKMNNHIWVELDIRPSLEINFSLQCTVDDLPNNLQFAYRYRLAGVIAKHKSNSSDHFIVYFKKDTDLGHTWLLCDDLNNELSVCHSSEVIIPMAAYYIREKSTSTDS